MYDLGLKNLHIVKEFVIIYLLRSQAHLDSSLNSLTKKAVWPWTSFLSLTYSFINKMYIHS